VPAPDSTNNFQLDFEAIPPPVRAVCQTLHRAGHEAFVVGGSVRDLLLKRPVADWDITTNARPRQVQRLFRKTIATGIQHGTVTVLAAQGFPVEVTTYRGEEGYGDGRRPDAVHFLDDLASDLERRDFTINAIALDPVARILRDPLDGRVDLKRRLVRAVGDPARRFGEDGLRPLRAIRFAAVLEFEIEQQTLAAIRPALATFCRVSIERIRDELFKLLRAPRPSVGLELLRDTGLLDEILPELDEAAGDVSAAECLQRFRVRLSICDRLPPDALLRLAGLLHGIGVDEAAGGAIVSSGRPDLAAATGCRAVGSRLRLANAERDRLCHLVAQQALDDTLADDAAIRRMLQRVSPAAWPDLATLRRAILATGHDAARRVRAFEAFVARVDEELARNPVLDVRDLALSGGDLMQHLGLSPGPAVGRLLRALLEQVIEEPELNQRQQLLGLADQLHSATPG
jgi:tRNA nucleotidyltransferase (CCA-adding enzyme)